MNLEDQLKTLKTQAKKLAISKISQRRQFLKNYAEILKEESSFLLAENLKDIQENKTKISPALLARLELDLNKIEQVINGIIQLSKINDPIAQVNVHRELDKGLELKKISCPLGTICIIFEARPDVAPQLLALSAITGNALVLKGGREAKHSVKAFSTLATKALKKTSEFTDQFFLNLQSREDIKELLSLDKLVDLVIPRGSKSLVKDIMSESKIPVIGHTEGICNIYVDDDCSLNMALKIILDSKLQYPSACNSVENLIIHNNIATEFLNEFIPASQKQNLELRLCSEAHKNFPKQKLATKEDWLTEYSQEILAVKIVSNLEEALSHIEQFSSGHTDCIISNNENKILRFFNEVDSANVFANASTRFADGFRYGKGAEIGISTAKMPPRGPVGIEGLMTYKYLLSGNGHIVAQYSGKEAKKFSHQDLLNV